MPDYSLKTLADFAVGDRVTFFRYGTQSITGTIDRATSAGRQLLLSNGSYFAGDRRARLALPSEEDGVKSISPYPEDVYALRTLRDFGVGDRVVFWRAFDSSDNCGVGTITEITTDGDGRRVAGGNWLASCPARVALDSEEDTEAFRGHIWRHLTPNLPAPESDVEDSDLSEVDALKAKVKEVAQRLAKQHGWCEVVDQALVEMGIVSKPDVTVTFTYDEAEAIREYLGAHCGAPADEFNGYRKLERAIRDAR